MTRGLFERRLTVVDRLLVREARKEIERLLDENRRLRTGGQVRRGAVGEAVYAFVAARHDAARLKAENVELRSQCVRLDGEAGRLSAQLEQLRREVAAREIGS